MYEWNLLSDAFLHSEEEDTRTYMQEQWSLVSRNWELRSIFVIYHFSYFENQGGQIETKIEHALPILKN